MPHFRDTPEAEAFIASASARETSAEIMDAIAFNARNLQEAEKLWRGEGFGVIAHPVDIWEHVTKNGLRDASEFQWGEAGSDWWAQIENA